jgi:hypothetical protein
MKFNKWTLGLAAVGVVSMASAVNADETTKLSPVETALTTTTISGAVDVAAQYNPGDAVQTPNGKVDNFSVNSATISLDRPMDESPWAAGYHIDLNAGTDAIDALDYSGGNHDVALRQAYVALRTPVGNGIDWKIGAFDGVTGYESNTGYLNPNYTRSYGYAMNPASEAGILGSYKFCDAVAIQMGMANSHNAPNYNDDGRENLTSHDYIAAVALTAPDSFGWLKGSVLNMGTIQSFEGNGANHYSVNATIATPVTGLKFGVAYDKLQQLANPQGEDGNVYGVYATYQATQKLGFNLRGEYIDGKNLFNEGYDSDGNLITWNGKGTEVTATIEYDLWQNVLTLAEFRWDHLESAQAFNYNNTADEYLLALNIVYKF